MQKKLSVKNIVLLVSVFAILYLSSGYTTATISGTILIGTSLIFAFIVMMVSGKNKISKRLLMTALVMCIIILIASIISGDNLKETLIMLSAVFTAVIFVAFLDFKVFCELYSKIMFFIAGYSLIAYFLSIAFPSVIRLFPPTYYRIGREAYNLGFTIVNLKLDPMRNMGMFWEPGAYQTYLVFAILIDIFVRKEKQRHTLFIYSLALLTTLSTTGIISGLILFLIYILKKNNKTKSGLLKVFVSLMAIFTVLLISYSFLPPALQYATIGKFAVYLNSDQSAITSTSVRMDGIIYPLKAFISSPILGVGYDGIYDSISVAGHSMATNTPINWFAAYGFFYGIICLYGVVGFAKRLDSKKLVYLLITLTILITISSEQYLRNSSIIIFILYGISEPIYNRRVKIKTDNESFA